MPLLTLRAHALRSAALVLAITLGACASPPLTRCEYTRVVMGVQCRIVLYAPDSEAGAGAARAAFHELARLEQIFSDYRETSEVSALASAAGARAVRVSPELVELLEIARRVHDATDGAFDVTVGPAVLLWRESRRTGEPPSEAAVARARTLIDGAAVRIDQWQVLLERPGMRLDLGGIAKGYSAQEALGVLRERGTHRSMVAIAGDIAVGDPPPGADGWRIGLPAPRDDVVLVLANTCISTSGDREQVVETQSERSAHIIDPRTGLGSTTLRTVTVVAASGAVADALASALSLLDGPAAARALQSFPRAEVVGGADDASTLPGRVRDRTTAPAPAKAR